MKIQFQHTFQDIASVENLLEAWREFERGKRRKRDVQEFSLRLMDNILALHHDLCNHTYKHGGYQDFSISDSKPRDIHKATVRDRLLHHAIYRVLYPFFDRIFVSDVFSCRLGKGTHKALDRFQRFGYGVSHNNTQTCWVLKCDIRKFFANIDQEVLTRALREHIPDDGILWLLESVIGSFHGMRVGIGLPLGNLTSPLLVNIYMNKFDHFIKHRLKAKHYIRYADDFVILSKDCFELGQLLIKIDNFLITQLGLQLHPDKVSIKTLSSGIDFLGWVHFPDHRVLRAATKRRALRRLRENPVPPTLNSYLGLLRHGNARSVIAQVWKEYILHHPF